MRDVGTREALTLCDVCSTAEPYQVAKKDDLWSTELILLMMEDQDMVFKHLTQILLWVRCWQS